MSELPFNPAEARFFDLVAYRLKLTEKEKSILARNGLITLGQGHRQSFPAAYRQVYTSDLPVFITSDSILHALHRSYDKILAEREGSYFR